MSHWGRFLLSQLLKLRLLQMTYAEFVKQILLTF